MSRRWLCRVRCGEQQDQLNIIVFGPYAEICRAVCRDCCVTHVQGHAKNTVAGGCRAAQTCWNATFVPEFGKLTAWLGNWLPSTQEGSTRASLHKPAEGPFAKWTARSVPILFRNSTLPLLSGRLSLVSGWAVGAARGRQEQRQQQSAPADWPAGSWFHGDSQQWGRKPSAAVFRHIASWWPEREVSVQPHFGGGDLNRAQYADFSIQTTLRQNSHSGRRGLRSVHTI